MPKNKKKKQKRVSPETLAKVKTGFATLISNDACIKASREWKGALQIIPIAIALASVVLAVLPTFTSRMNVQGSVAIFSGNSANYEQGFANFTHTLTYDADDVKRGTAIELVIKDGTFSINGTQDPTPLTGGSTKWYTVDRASTDQEAFEVFFNNSPHTDATFFEYVDANKNPYTGESRSAEGKKEYPSSYLIFGKQFLRYRKRTSAKTFAALNGRYDRLEGVSFTKFAIDQDTAGLSPLSTKYLENARKLLTDVINRSYETDKIAGTWQYTGIFAGIDAGLIILFGLLMFIMTRGKKNPFRIYTFWETQKMAYFASFTPAILGMILGFWLTQYAFIFFMFAYGMRMMWMSMRSLRPAAQ